MIPWWSATYGNPCRSCGFDWSLPPAQAVSQVMAAPQRYAALLSGTDGSQRHPELSWSAKGYVFHVADNLSIWSERLAAALAGASGVIASYDDNLLARARSYEKMPLEAALWSLRHATVRWQEVMLKARERRITLQHPDRGSLTADDIARSNCHDVVHHGWDIQRSIAGRPPRGVPT